MSQVTAHAVTLSGSTAVIVEYFGFAFNSILRQRGVYPADCFQQVRKCGTDVYVSTDADLNDYLSALLQRVAKLVSQGACRRLVLLITDPTREDRNGGGGGEERVVERWEFCVERLPLSAVPPQEQRAEFASVMAQIVACYDYLPPPADEEGEVVTSLAFDVLVYTTMDAEMDEGEWERSTPRLLPHACELQLRPLRAPGHRVQTNVSYA